jgi:hypothetical protein
MENAKLIMLNNTSAISNKTKAILISCYRILMIVIVIVIDTEFPEQSINIQYKYNISVN